MSFLDFLTEGEAPQGVPTWSQTQNVLPDWYSNYAMQVLSNQQAVSAQPYTTYQAPRVAGFTPDQQSGFDATRAAAGAYQPGLNTAQQQTNDLFGRSALGAAQPFLERAGQSSVANIGDYMNPYTDRVVDRIGDVAARNLQEKFLPAINDRFIGAGQYGGTRQAEEMQRTVRDLQESTLAEQARALQSGYSEAAGLAGTDLARAGQIGSTVGSMYGQDTEARRAAAAQAAGLAGQAQGLGLTGAGALTQVGAAQQGLNQQNLDTAYSDFLRQQGYPQEQINAMISTMRGIQPAVPTGTQQGVNVPSGAPYGLSPLEQIGGIADTIGGLGGISGIVSGIGDIWDAIF